MKKKVSIKTIAKLSNVSVATVSRVINNRGSVCKEARERVKSTIESLNYVPNRGDRRVPHVGVIIPMAVPHFGEYHSQIIDGVIRGGMENNISVSIQIYTKNLRWKKLVPMLRRNNCDAAIVISSQVRPEVLEELKKSSIPTMVINDQCRGEAMGYVDINSYDGVNMGMDYLKSLGHSRIGFLNGADCKNHRERKNAFIDFFAKNNMHFDEKWIADFIPAVSTADSGYYELENLLKRCNDLTAVLAINDEMAEGALAACSDLGIKVPNQLSIIGFDGLKINKYLRPELTTIAQPLETFGYKAVEAIGLFLRDSMNKLPCIVYSPDLIIRKSCKKARSLKR